MNREREHAVEFLGKRGAPFKPSRGKDFGIAARVKVVAVLLELMAELLPVVDFAIADGTDRSEEKWLLPIFLIEDGKAGETEGNLLADVGASLIWPTVVERVEHARESVLLHKTAPSNSTHITSLDAVCKNEYIKI